MTDPEGLHRGPDVDGRPTWYGPFECIPRGWEYRSCTDLPWGPCDPPRGYTSKAVMQARPVALPDPDGIALADYGSYLVHGSTEGLIVTTVGEMRERGDLDQWEWASAGRGTWTPWFPEFAADDDFPVIVRRRP